MTVNTSHIASGIAVFILHEQHSLFVHLFTSWTTGVPVTLVAPAPDLLTVLNKVSLYVVVKEALVVVHDSIGAQRRQLTLRSKHPPMCSSRLRAATARGARAPVS